MGRRKAKKLPKFFRSGRILKAWRLARNQTQRDLAKELGDMNSQFVSNWERGLCLPPKHAMPKILEDVSATAWNDLKCAVGDDLAEHYWEGFGQ